MANRFVDRTGVRTQTTSSTSFSNSVTMDGGATGTATGLRQPMLERAIGVIYLPATERVSHYFHARLSDQFDAVLHFDETRAVEPLERTGEWEIGEVPETFPSGM